MPEEEKYNHVISQFLLFLLQDLSLEKMRGSSINMKNICDSFIRLGLFVRLYQKGKNDEIMCNLFSQIFPIIELLTTNFGSDQFLMDSIVTFLRYFVSFHGHCIKGHLPKIIEYVVMSFKLYKNPEILSLSRTIVREFMIDESGQMIISQMITEIFKIISTSNDLGNQVFENYYHLMTCYLEVSPLNLVQTELVFKVLEMSIPLISIRDSNLQREIFIFAKICYENDLLRSVKQELIQLIPMLTMQIFSGFAFTYCRFLISTITDVFSRYFEI